MAKQKKIYNLLFTRKSSSMIMTRTFKTKKEANAEAKLIKENPALEFVEITETKVGA
tara:strand:- start:1623 stop:1793 length:171 start_codon:yes stop_codon:yes gene_type:complete